jgi:hypothetical protein
MKLAYRWATMVVAFAASGSLALVACGGDDNKNNADSGNPHNDGGPEASQSVYEILGEHAGIRALVNDSVAIIGNDATLKTYFVFNGSATSAPATGHPNFEQIEECFTYFLSSQQVVGAPSSEKYPITLDSGYACRPMGDAHKDLMITGPVFDAFVADIAMAGMNHHLSSTILTAAAGLLNGYKTMIVTSTVDAEVPYMPNGTGGDSGGGNDSGTD